MVSCWLRQRVLIGVIMAAGYCVGSGAVEMPDSTTAGSRGGDATPADAALAVTGCTARIPRISATPCRAGVHVGSWADSSGSGELGCGISRSTSCTRPTQSKRVIKGSPEYLHPMALDGIAGREQYDAPKTVIASLALVEKQKIYYL